jgi:hypothetical protein
LGIGRWEFDLKCSIVFSSRYFVGEKSVGTM